MKQKILLLAIAGGVVALFAFGVLNWQQVAAWGRRFFYQGRSVASKATDFTTPELKSVPEAQQCRANLRRIEDAKRAVSDKRAMAVGRLTWDDIKREMGGQIPKCPSGGAYGLGNIGSMPTCTIGSNGTGRPEDDHIVINY